MDDLAFGCKETINGFVVARVNSQNYSNSPPTASAVR
jgi:hypothetical protein